MAILVYITCADEAEARRVAAGLLDERLIACANIVPGVLSLYEWQGQREESREYLLLAKSMEDRLETLCARVRALHSYDLPCVTAVPLAGGNAAYLDWIRVQTRPRG